jgi:hypothetical protein
MRATLVAASAIKRPYHAEIPLRQGGGPIDGGATFPAESSIVAEPARRWKNFNLPFSRPTVVSICARGGSELMTPQETSWLRPELIPERNDQLLSAAGVQVCRTHRQPQTESK